MKITFVKKARKDIWKKNPNGTGEILIPKGTSYYWWKHAWMLRTVSVTKPTPQQLKHPNASTWDDDFSDLESQAEDCDYGDLEELKDKLEELNSELEDNLSNIPEQLQESSVLNERIEQVEELIRTVEERLER